LKANKALKFIPNHVSIYFIVAILEKKGKSEETDIQFKQAISKDLTVSMIYANLGILRNAWERENSLCQMDHLVLSISENK